VSYNGALGMARPTGKQATARSASTAQQSVSPEEQAAGLKAKCNDAFKAFRLEDAIEAYSAAMAPAPHDPVYRANRSAALFEAGRYAEASRTSRLR
jgi:Flp pilus assembly protein TadD